jgi:hypothetical protein
MTATIDLTDDELEDIRKLTRVNDVTAAIRSALQEYIRYARRMHLKSLSGHVTMENNWLALEAAETDAPGPH